MDDPGHLPEYPYPDSAREAPGLHEYGFRHISRSAEFDLVIVISPHGINLEGLVCDIPLHFLAVVYFPDAEFGKTFLLAARYQDFVTRPVEKVFV